MNLHYNLAGIARALGKAQRSGNGWMCLCPAHDDRNPSLSIALGNDGKLLVHCFAGCDPKNILDALRKLGMLDGASRQYTSYYSPRNHNTAGTPREWSTKAEHIWNMAIPIIGTPVEVYLPRRNCLLPSCTDLRCLPSTDGSRGYPVMLAKVTDALTNKPLTLHFTYLLSDGSDKAPVEHSRILLKGHRKAGGVIRLVDDAEVTMGLGIAEGIETALSVMQSGWQPVWAAIDASNIATLPVIPGIECLTIFADQDQAGLSAGQKCANRWLEAGRGVRIVAPNANGNDWNDVMTGVQNEA